MSELGTTERAALGDTVEAVRRLARDTAANILHIGTRLLNARRLLGKGFPKWVQSQFAWSMRDVARMIRVARTFAATPPPALERFEPTALCVLAERSAPSAARRAALDAAERGQKVSAAAAQALVAAARGTVRPAGPKGKDDGAADRVGREDDTLRRLGWEAVEKLTADGGSIRLGRLPDREEDDDAARPWVCHWYKPDGAVLPFVSKDSAASALTLAAGTQPSRGCKTCGWTGPAFDGFSRKVGNPLGRSFCCRRCETRRVGDQKKIRRGTATEEELKLQPPVRPAAPPEPKGNPASPPAAKRTPPAG